MSIFYVVMTLARHPPIVETFKNTDYDIVSHGWRWIHYQEMKSADKKQHIQLATSVLTEPLAKPPTDWYTDRES